MTRFDVPEAGKTLVVRYNQDAVTIAQGPHGHSPIGNIFLFIYTGSQYFVSRRCLCPILAQESAPTIDDEFPGPAAVQIFFPGGSHTVGSRFEPKVILKDFELWH